MSILEEHTSASDGVAGIDRRSFVGYVLAGTTLVAAADFALGSPALAADGVNGPQIAEFYDLNDFIELPYRLRRDDPQWVPPLRFERRQFLDRKRNPWFDHSEAELLLADSSRARLVRSAGEGHDRACGVESPRDCVAVRRGQTLTFPDSDELDACPHLRGRASTCSSVCVPVNVLGNTVGVLHAVGDAGSPPPQDVAIRLETISTQAGARIGMLRALQRSEIQAATDPLTGLLNRRAFVETLTRRLAGRGSGRTYATVVMVDLDDFKRINDTHGHAAGDRVIREVSERLAKEVGESGMASRSGGDEFIILVQGFTDKRRLNLLCAGIIESILKPIRLDGGETADVGVSLGVAQAPLCGITGSAIMRAADEALYAAKQMGRGRAVFAEALDVPPDVPGDPEATPIRAAE